MKYLIVSQKKYSWNFVTKPNVCLFFFGILSTNFCLFFFWNFVYKIGVYSFFEVCLQNICLFFGILSRKYLSTKYLSIFLEFCLFFPLLYFLWNFCLQSKVTLHILEHWQRKGKACPWAIGSCLRKVSFIRSSNVSRLQWSNWWRCSSPGIW